MSIIKPRDRAYYFYYLDMPTRWMDNDLYGHVNNVTYFAYFDTVINRYLIDEGGLDIQNSGVIGVVAENMCRFHKAVAYPEKLQAGLRVRSVGNSSVNYEVGIFSEKDKLAAATGYFVHVFIERKNQNPTQIPQTIRLALNNLTEANIN
jgi:acyl-CoA thioester hydrolase